MHGRLDRALCAACGHRWPAPLEMRVGELCPKCDAGAGRPDVVWFGEVPHGLDEIDRALSAADLFAAIGTSGEVYPAAGFVEMARAVGARTVELNLAPGRPGRFDEVRQGPATETLPAWVAELVR